MASTSRLSAEAQRTFQQSFEKLEQTFTKFKPSFALEMRDSNYEQISEALILLEQELTDGNPPRDMRKMKPFSEWLQQFQHVVETSLGNTDYVSWIWVRFFRDIQFSLLMPFFRVA